MSDQDNQQQADDDALFEAFMSSRADRPRKREADPEYDAFARKLFPGWRHPDPAA
jgi:hypothetical protein